jgi:hypothetical protein
VLGKKSATRNDRIVFGKSATRNDRIVFGESTDRKDRPVVFGCGPELDNDDREFYKERRIKVKQWFKSS